MSKLLLVDGSALLHRAYHAYPPLTSKTGEIVGAVYGVVSILISALDSEKPTHVMVAWDLPKPTFRHEKYVGYKAQRPKADEEMVLQIPLVKEVIGAMGIVQVEQEGYEADDIIGTLSMNQEGEVVILTGDQDTMQLVSPHVRVLTPAKGANPPVLYGPDEVWNKYGVHPEQMVDYKALVGDPSDNIPGVAGIGPKGAANLIKTFGSLERIYRDIKEVQTQFGELTAKKLADGRESAFMSQDLSKIVTDMPLSVKIEEMEYRGLQSVGLREKLEELGFKSMIRRIFGDELKQPKNDNQMGLF
ncbi:MAG: 5'-3' exonuclease H3TH domain-containing protein [bacterium]